MQLNLNESLNSALSAADMGDIQAAALQAGVVDANNIKQIQEYTKIVNNAALAFDMTGETAGSAFATIQAQITGSMDETARMFDVVNAISNTTNASAQDLLTVIQRSGGIVKNFTALSDESLVAMSAAFRAASSSAEEAATSQAAFIAALTKGKGATNTQIEGFERLGINVQKLSSALLAGPESAQSAIVEVFNALRNLNETERADVMSKIFGGDKGTLNAIASILGQTDKLLMQPLNIASNEQNFNGSMAKEAATQASTTANQIKILENNIQNLKIIIGNEFLPVWNTILSHVIEFAQLLSHTSKEFPSFTKGILAVVAGLGLLKVIMGGFSFVFGIVSSVVLLGRKTVLLFQGAMLVLNGTMAVTSMGMKALVLMSKLFIAGFGKARVGAILLTKGLAALPGLLLSIGTSALSAGKSLLAIAFLKVKSLALIASKALLALRGAFAKLALAMLTNPIGLIITAIGLLIAIGIALYKNWDTVKAKVSELWASFKEKFPSLATIATVAFGLIFKAFRIFPKAINVISEAVQWFVDSDWATIWTTIKDLAAEGLDSLISWISSTFSDAWSTAWSGITGIFGDIFNGLIELAKAPIDWVTEKINSAISTITNGFNSVKNFFFGDDKEEAALKAEKNINVNQQALSPALSQPAMFNPALSGPTAVSPVVQLAPNLANVPQLASGGIVSEPTLAMIGEGNESEAVLPLSKLQGFLKGDTVNNQSSSQSITVNFNPVINVDGNSNADPYAQVKKALSEGSQDLRRQLIDLMNRQGRLSYD